MARSSELDSIVYISIPESITQPIGSFRIDTSILLPVELPGESERFDPAELSWEMIVAGMLKVIGYDTDNPDLDYYRNFVFALKPDIVRELMTAGISKAEQKEYPLAEEIFLILCRLLPADHAPAMNLAFAYEEHAESCDKAGAEADRDSYMEKAHAEYKRALEAWPNTPDVLYYAGHFFLRRGNFTKASDCFASFMNLETDNERKTEIGQILETIRGRDQLDALFTEAFDFIRLGKEEEGIARISRFIEKNRDVWNAWFLLGWAQRRLGRYEEARESFTTALTQNPSHVHTLYELSICAMELGDNALSRKYLRKALELEPENVKIISNLGILSLREDKLKEAEGFFRTVLLSDPEDRIALRYLELIKSRSGS